MTLSVLNRRSGRGGGERRRRIAALTRLVMPPPTLGEDVRLASANADGRGDPFGPLVATVREIR
jgi:hypothetical protein